MLYPAGKELAARQPALLGCAENGLGLRDWLEGQGHTFVGELPAALACTALTARCKTGWDSGCQAWSAQCQG